MKYSITISRTADKNLKNIPKMYMKQIFTKIEELSENPYPKDSKKLKGSDYYRIIVSSYRIIYSIVKDILKIFIVNISHRKDIYNKLN